MNGPMSAETRGEMIGKTCDPVIPNVLAGANNPDDTAADQLIPNTVEDVSQPSNTLPENSANLPEPLADDAAWRDELSARLSRYRARRKLPPPRYPSLSLKFDPAEAVRRADAPHASLVSFEPLSDQALALNSLAPASPQVSDEKLPSSTLSEPAASPANEPAARVAAASALRSGSHSAAHSGAKIIEFPRFAWAPPPPPLDQLAEPVSTRPRILEVPDFTPPPPALGGITIEPAEREDAEKRLGIDYPLQSVSLTRRMFATAVDVTIIATAAAAFGFIFWKITDINPPLMQIMELAAGVPCLFWAVYQYLLIVYSGSTPGLRAAGLELARFDGSPTTRSLRRWRVIASYLSAASLGMGYAWVFLDEDSLCWHDRATRTYLAPKAVDTKQ